VQQLIEAYNAGELEPLPGRTLEETLEMRIMQTLGKARDTAGKIAVVIWDWTTPVWSWRSPELAAPCST